VEDAKKKKIIERYWLNRLSGDLPKITLPQYNREGASEEMEKQQVELQIPNSISAKLVHTSNHSDIAMFILFFTGIAVVLHKYTGLEDLLIGTVTPKKEMVKSKLIFCRTQIRANLPLKEALNQVKQNVLEDFNYTDEYSFGELYQKLSALKVVDHPDIFNIAFVYDKLQKKGKLKFLNQFHLVISLSNNQNENQLRLQAAYNANIYSEGIIRRFCENLIYLFDHLAEKLDHPLTDIGILSLPQSRELWDFNRTAVSFPRDTAIHRLFEEQAGKTPDNIALIFKDSHLSYSQLNEGANQLAGILIEKGVNTDSIVGLMTDRSIEMVIGQLAIFKAGGAYLPIDPGIPTNRIVSMLDDCGCSLLFTKNDIEAERGGHSLHSYTTLQGLQSPGLVPHVTTPRQRIVDFDTLPFPNRSLINYEKYNRCIGQAVVKNRILIQASRGCPYDCSYCYRIWPRKQVARSGENLFEEVKLYYDLGIRKFDIFMMNLKQGRKFFELVIQHRMQHLQLFFPNGFRGDLLTREYVDLMVKAGTVNFALALETASPRLQKLINKNLNLEKLREIIGYICQKYPQVILELFTMHGIPSETEEEARMTMDFIKRFKWIHFPYVHVLKIYHGTGMEPLALQSGITPGQISRSENLAWHELSDTLPFERSFSAGYQAEFLNDYVLSRERLLRVLPQQVKILTEDEIVEKYDSYLPTDIKSFHDLLTTAGITKDELTAGRFCDKTKDEAVLVDLNEKLKQHFPTPGTSGQALRVLLLDLSQFFTDRGHMLYDVVDVPLGLMYILTYLHQQMGNKINGKILKSRMDFDSLEELKTITEEFQPQVIGVRSLTFYKDFFHETVAALRNWGFAGPIIAGGPHATVDYETLLQDRNINLVVFSEGEQTFCEILERIIDNQGKLPGEEVLKEIPGIAFIPEKEIHARGYAREVLMMDQLTGTLSQKTRENPITATHSYNLAYVIFTSGSTGIPKGVLIQHQNAVNVLKWFGQAYGIQPNTHVIQMTNYTFDPSVEQIYGALLHGATVFIPTREDISNREKFAQFVNRKQINMVNSVPILLKELLGYGEKLESLDIVISGGEKLEKIVKNQILKKGYRLYNQYGPTETTIDTLMTPCSTGDVTLGRPIANVFCRILDKNYHPVPIGVAGELLVGGAGVSRGYLNHPELTAERFFYRSYRSYKSYISEKVYRTGDLARWHESGNIEFLDRIDHQVKIRGFRIELGEIESYMRKYQKVNEAVVVTREVNEDNIFHKSAGVGDKFLAAYLTPEPGVSVSVPGLREYLSLHLPNYMIPAYFVVLESLPLNPHGKIDRKALPDPTVDSSAGTTDYTPPGNTMEEKLVEIWEGVLGRKPIGINDNFFTIGGDSIKSIQIASRMNMEGYKLEMRDIFQFPIISQLASKVQKLKRHSDQSVVTGIVPLMPAQLEFFEKYKIAPHHFNQSVMLYSQEGFEEKAVRTVFTRIQEHHDTLRITFKKEDDGKIVQTNHGLDYPLSLQVFDLRGSGDLHEALAILGNKANEIQAAIDLEQGPLMTLGLFQVHDGDRLLIVIHHLVIDGISWRILLEDIETLYRQYRDKQPLELPLKTDSFKTWSEQICQYANSPVFLAEKDYWREMESQPIPRIEKDFQAQGNLFKDAVSLSFQLTSEETTRLLTRVNHAFATEINDILLTALLLAIQETHGNNRLLIVLEGHGREEILENIDISRTIGWFTSVYPVLLEFSSTVLQMDDTNEGKTARQIIEIKEILHQLPYRGIGYGLLKYLTTGEHKRGIYFNLTPQISFNYLGQFDANLEKASFGMAVESPGNNISEANAREYDLEISGIIANERLTISIVFNRTNYRTASIETILRLYKEKLLHIISYCSSREHTQPTPSDFTYKKLSVEAVEAIAAAVPSPIDDIYTLAPMQEGMLFHALVDPLSSVYFEQTSYRLHGQLDVDIVQKSLDELVKRYDILRTLFIYEGLEQPVQVVLKEQTADFLYEDIAEMNEGTTTRQDKEKYVREFKKKDRHRSFDLSKDKLIRVAVVRINANEYEFIWSHHHILMDGWCTGVLVAEYLEIYQSYLANHSWQLPAVTPYRTYICWLEKQDKQASADFWQKYLEDYNTTAAIALMGELKAGKTRQQPYQDERFEFQLEQERSESLNRLAAGNQVTLYTVIQVLWGIMLSKYHNNTRDVVFGSVVSGRPPGIPGVESMVGLFINTIPMRITYHPKTTVKELLKNIQEDALSSEPYHYYPLARIQTHHLLKQHLLDHILLFENFPVTAEVSRVAAKSQESHEGPALKFSNIEAFEQTNYDFNLVIIPADGLILRFEYNGNCFDKKSLERIASHFSQLLDQFLDNEDREVDGLALLSSEEKKQVLEEFNQTGAFDLGMDKTLPGLFEKQTEQTPGHVALIGKEEGWKARGGLVSLPDPESITYCELNEKSNQLAHLLIAKGVKINTIVALLVESSIEMIVSIFAILKAGAAYLPIDPDYPEARIEYMLTDSSVTFLVTTHGLSEKFEKLSTLNCQLLMVNEKPPVSSHLHLSPVPITSLAYIIYTSGTTGRPKGVCIEHRGVVNTLGFRKQAYKMGISNISLQLFSYGFDGFVTSFFTPIVSGATVVLSSKEELQDVFRIKGVISRYLVSHFICVPSLYRVIIQSLTAAEASSIKTVTLAGDILPPDLLAITREKGKHIEIAHEYGVSEGSVMSTLYRHQERDNRIKIGTPIGNTQLYIVDKQYGPQPIGVPGELCISGVGVARGYLNNPELTAEKFDHDLWDYQDKSKKVPGKKNKKNYMSYTSYMSHIYKTGDLARWLPDGMIEFLGRIDHQVKIRGFRIEPGEIGRRLLQHPQIKEAVVTTKEAPGDLYLCAYIIPNDPADNDSSQSLSVPRLRKYLLAYLPDYMIPAQFVQVRDIPLTPNGKVDTLALHSMGIPIGTGVEYAPPTNELEKIVANTWKDILQLDKVGINDNFFDLGGNSMNIIHVNSRLKKELQKDIAIVTLFEYPTISTLLQYLAQEGSGEPEAQEMEEYDLMQDEAASMREQTLQIIDTDDEYNE
jgi:amino acid adenylation domain-containing protein/non-ribosomal peptide synthase protein (TIGR01720 family)